MEQTLRASLWLSLDSTTDWQDVNRLMNSLTDLETGILAEPAGGGPGTGDIVLGVMVFLTSATTLANQMLEIAEKLGRWRKQQHQQGRPTRVHIEQSGGDVIDLEGVPADDLLPLITALTTPGQIPSPQESDNTSPEDKDPEDRD